MGNSIGPVIEDPFEVRRNARLHGFFDITRFRAVDTDADDRVLGPFIGSPVNFNCGFRH